MVKLSFISTLKPASGNVLPQITVLGPDPVVQHGSDVSRDLIVTDPDDGPGALDVSADIGDVQFVSGNLFRWDYTGDVADDGETVTIVADDTGGQSPASFPLVVTSAPCIPPQLEVTVDTSPTNPAHVSVAAKATPMNPGEAITSLTFEVRGTPTAFVDALGGEVNLADWAGQTVDFAVKATGSCGPTSETEVVEEIVIPPWNDVFTLDRGQSESATNFHTFGNAFAAMDNRDRLNVAAGTYKLWDANEDPGRLFFQLKSNCYVAAEGALGSVTIDGNSAAASSNNGLSVSGTILSVFEKIRFTNTHWSAVTGSSATDGVTFRDCETDGHRGHGFHTTGNLNMKYIRCRAINGLDRKDALGNVDAASGFHFDNGVNGVKQRTMLFDCLAENNFGDGYNIRNVEDTLLQNCDAIDNGRQGVLTHRTEGLTIVGGEMTGNAATGIQIESMSLRIYIRNANSHDNNSPSRNGEGNIWFDDSSQGVIEFCPMYGSAMGFRVDGDAPPQGQTFSTDVIVRHCEVYDVNGIPTEPGEIHGGKLNGSKRVYMYNLTFARNGHATKTSAHGNFVVFDRTGFENTGVYLKNCIFVDPVLGPTSGQIEWQGNSAADADLVDDNIYFNGGSSGYKVNGTATDFDAYKTTMATWGHEQNSIEADPLLDANFVPQTGSPAKGTANRLATIQSINGTTIGLDYPGVFSAGGFEIDGDEIKFENGEVRTVQAVTDTDSTKEIEIDSPVAGIAIGEGVRLTTTIDKGSKQTA